MKRLIVACDGTWNRPESPSRGSDAITNVTKIVRAIVPTSRDGHTSQVIEYVRGVGTGNALDRKIGGLTGDGISGNIEQAYHFIANNYTRGDDIYLFGFSRGAFTARSLSGFLHHVGILPKRMLHRFPEAYDSYRARSRVEMAILRRRFAQEEVDPGAVSVPVRFLGVWDTVGSLGTIPYLTEPDVGFHDTELSPNVTAAYHALAVHELRADFPATLWTRKHDGQTVEQVWFSGAHSDVGGGYPETGLSDLTLEWMVDAAEANGLELDQQYVDDLRPDGAAAIHRSVSGIWRGRSKGPRAIDATLGVDQYVHPTVVERRKAGRHSGRHAGLLDAAEDSACRLPVLTENTTARQRAARREAEAKRAAESEASRRASEKAARDVARLKAMKPRNPLR